MAATKAARAKTLATKLHSEIVRARGACEACGSTRNLQCAHIISRRYAHTRTEIDNALALCASCHIRFTEWPLEFAEFVNEHCAPGQYEQMVARSQRRGKVDWEAEVVKLRAIYAEVTMR